MTHSYHDRAWTYDDDDFVRAHYLEQSYSWIASRLGRTVEAVRARAFLIGCQSNCMANNRRDNAYMKRIMEELS